VRRAVWQRDGGRCAFIGRDGRRCDARGFVEFHHVKPFAAGGEASVANIELRCRPHNQYEADVYFAGGPESRASHIRESVAEYDVAVYEAAVCTAGVYGAAVYETVVYGAAGYATSGTTCVRQNRRVRELGPDPVERHGDFGRTGCGRDLRTGWEFVYPP
jgi:hypothetical protein